MFCFLMNHINPHRYTKYVMVIEAKLKCTMHLNFMQISASLGDMFCITWNHFSLLQTTAYIFKIFFLFLQNDALCFEGQFILVS